MNHTILVATTNPGKVAEFKTLLPTGITWLGLQDVPAMPEVNEDGLTFAENARKKAMAYAQASGHWTLSDDSGLVIDALDGAPGVHSARYAGIKSTDRTEVDQANMKKVLSELENTPPHDRSARFVCCLCLASPNSILLETEGLCEGNILDQPIGSNGFGYDPIFFIPSANQTMAQMNSHEKNAISHRGKALRSIKPGLEQLLSQTEIR